MKKNIKIIITKNKNNDNLNDNDNLNLNDNDNLNINNDLYNSKIINSYIDDIEKKDNKINYNLQYIINMLQYLIINIIKKYIILILLILIIIYFYKKYT